MIHLKKLNLLNHKGLQKINDFGNDSGGGSSSGILNAEIVGTPTISDDFILSNADDSNYLLFVPPSPTNQKITIQTKFRISDLTKKGCLFMCAPDKSGFKISYNDDGAGQGGISFLIGGRINWWNSSQASYYTFPNVYTTANQWVWIKVVVYGVVESGNNNYEVYKSTNGTTWKLIKGVSADFGDYPQFGSSFYEQIGTGDSNNTIEIDLKECKYYLDDVLSWKAVRYNESYTIPSQYTEVDYIQSSGTQYINTGYNLKAHDKVKMKFTITGFNGDWDSLFGSRLGSYQSKCYCAFCKFLASDKFAFARTGSEANSSVVSSTNVEYTVLTQNNSIVIIAENNNVYNFSSSGTLEDCENPCGIFVLNSSSSQNGFSADVPSKIKLKEFVIYDNTDNVSRQYVPVLDSSDNKYKLYETKTNTILANAGSGDFAGGNEQ